MSEDFIQQIVVTVDDAYQGNIQIVANNLHAAGMQVEQVMPTIGIIAGAIAESELANLSAIVGVLKVEADEQMDGI